MDKHLEVFLTVAEMKNFSRAADELHMTQPAVSQYIRAFEEEIGTRLLERTNKYVRLNKAGQIVYHHGKEIVGTYTTMQHLVDDLTNKASGSLAIGASYTFGEYILPHVIAKMKVIYPNIHPSITIGNTAKIAHLVGTHQLDIGIVEGHFDEQQLVTEEFAVDKMVIVASKGHPLTQKEQVEASDLEKEAWIVREQGSGTREATDKVFKLLKIEPAHIMHFSSTQLIKESVEVGLGVSLISQWAIQKELKNGDLTMIHIKKVPLSRQFSMITKSPFQTKALEVFVSLLRHDKALTTIQG